MSVDRCRHESRGMLRYTWMMLLMAIGVLLATCATPTPYQPVSGRYGYSNQLIETGRYKVSFSGNSLTKRETVEIYLLYRAAEITLQTGNDYFVVTERDTDEEITYRASYGFYPYSDFYYSMYFHGGHRHLYPYYGYGYGYGFGYDDFYSRPITRYTASVDIVTYQGEKPREDPAAYDARDVVRSLGPSVVRPEQTG